MVLHSFGVEAAESELRELCDCTSFGTEALKAIDAARRLGFTQTAKHTLTLAELQRELARGLYPIVYLNLLPLDGVKGEHAVVVVAQGKDFITIYDPLRGERKIARPVFAAAWAVMRNLAILLER